MPIDGSDSTVDSRYHVLNSSGKNVGLFFALPGLHSEDPDAVMKNAVKVHKLWFRKDRATNKVIEREAVPR